MQWLKKWFSQTAHPPRIPEFYTITEIQKANPVGRLIKSSCEGLTERISSFVDSPLQPSADFITFLENTEVLENTSLYTNIPREEGITTACNAYERFHDSKPPIPTHFIRDMLQLILKEISSLIKTAIETTISFANLFMSWLGQKSLRRAHRKSHWCGKDICVFFVEHKHWGYICVHWTG